MTSSTMKAMEIADDGKAFQIEIPKPKPAKKQVLVKVKYSAVDTAVDAVLGRTWVGGFLHAKTKPRVLGWHFSGTIEQVGTDVTDFKVYDDVFGHLQYAPETKQGAFAEYVTVPAQDLAMKPETIDHDIAAASTTEGITALQAMRDLGGLSEGQSILIIGAGGGVGSSAVAIAKRLGGQVTAVCSTRDVERVGALGADNFIDRTKMEPFSGDAKYDVIFDTPCAYSAIKSLGKLNSKGTYVTPLPSWSLALAMFLSLFTGKGAKFVGCRSKKEDLELLGKWLEDGMKVEIDSKYPISKLADAIQQQRKRTKTGRVVVKVEGGW
jgi:NADPH:quinone reductase-like Zn-dependent oxidoreductase